MQEGLADMEDARRDKATDEHNVIDDAIQDRGEGYTVFSIVRTSWSHYFMSPKLVLFRTCSQLGFFIVHRKRNSRIQLQRITWAKP